MTEPIHKGKDLLPVWVIHAASGGDSEAMEQVLRYYDDYMSRLCTRIPIPGRWMCSMSQTRAGSCCPSRCLWVNLS